jgi:hypothetical protein
LLAELFVAGSELQKRPRFHGAIGGLRSGDVLVQLDRGWEVASTSLLMQRFANRSSASLTFCAWNRKPS